jgi:thioredoxin 2
MEQASHHIVRCTSCGAKNRIPAERTDTAARCGRCGVQLHGAENNGHPAGAYTLRCEKCKTKNRVPAARIEADPKCGRCAAALPTRELFTPQPVMVTDANFEKTVLASPLPVLMYCWAPWCPTCGTVTPLIDEFARESKGKVRVGKINVDANRETAARYNVLSVPYLFVFDNGKLQESLPGGLPKHELMMKMAHYL